MCHSFPSIANLLNRSLDQSLIAPKGPHDDLLWEERDGVEQLSGPVSDSAGQRNGTGHKEVSRIAPLYSELVSTTLSCTLDLGAS